MKTIKERLLELHVQENEFNKAIGKIDVQIFKLKKEKIKLAKRVSHNMLFRNKLINQL